MRARSAIWPGSPHEKRTSRRPCPSGLTSAKRPRSGRLPQSSMFWTAPTPRPCGEITSGIGGWRRGPYQRGSTRKASRSAPLWARYAKPMIFTSAAGAWSGTVIAAATGTATRVAAATTRTALRRLAKGVVGSRVARGLGTGKPSRPCHDGDEREHPERARSPVRQPFVEERGAGDDRQGVRQQRRDPGGGERSAALEAELEGDEGEPVACEERRHERKPAAAAHRRLRPYVPRRVEEPRGRAEPRRRRQAAPVAEQRNRACRGSREREPEHDRAGGSLPPSA